MLVISKKAIHVCSWAPASLAPAPSVVRSQPLREEEPSPFDQTWDMSSKPLLRWAPLTLELDNYTIPALPLTAKIVPKEPKALLGNSSIACEDLRNLELFLKHTTQGPAKPPTRAALATLSLSETSTQSAVSIYAHFPSFSGMYFLLSLGSAQDSLK